MGSWKGTTLVNGHGAQGICLALALRASIDFVITVLIIALLLCLTLKQPWPGC